MMSTNTPLATTLCRPARHMCAESPKLAPYALVLWRFEEVTRLAKRAGVNVSGQAHCKNAGSSKGFRLLRTYRSVPGHIPQPMM